MDDPNEKRTLTKEDLDAIKRAVPDYIALRTRCQDRHGWIAAGIVFGSLILFVILAQSCRWRH
jgi:hypothetical protein